MVTAHSMLDHISYHKAHKAYIVHETVRSYYYKPHKAYVYSTLDSCYANNSGLTPLLSILCLSLGRIEQNVVINHCFIPRIARRDGKERENVTRREDREKRQREGCKKEERWSSEGEGEGGRCPVDS